MADSDRPHSPLAGKLDFSARTPVRALSLDEIEQMLVAHWHYLETERRQGSRADFGSAGLSGHDFSGLNMRRIKMDRAVLKGADFTGAHLQRANLISAEPTFDPTQDMTRGRFWSVTLFSAISASAGCNLSSKVTSSNFLPSAPPLALMLSMIN